MKYILKQKLREKQTRLVNDTMTRLYTRCPNNILQVLVYGYYVRSSHSTNQPFSNDEINWQDIQRHVADKALSRCISHWHSEWLNKMKISLDVQG